MKALPQALFVSHGGGPLPLLGDPAHAEMVSTLRDIAACMARPEAIVVVSAHWETEAPTVTASPAPGVIHDYYGFPEAAYEIGYPCPGAPHLAERLMERLRATGIEAGLDAQRGLDHGVYVPLAIMYPAADIPCVQLSLCESLDPGEHIAMGEALTGLAGEGVLLLGSGFSFHNMRAFFGEVSAQGRQHNADFENWLAATCGDASLSEGQRRDRLVHWEQASGARYCHPREEHLLPLHVCYGAAASAYRQRYALSILHRQASMILW